MSDNKGNMLRNIKKIWDLYCWKWRWTWSRAFFSTKCSSAFCFWIFENHKEYNNQAIVSDASWNKVKPFGREFLEKYL